MKFTEGLVSGFACAVIIAVIIQNGSNQEKLKAACEKDLARNLKCEMVYVKPSIKEGE